MFITSSSVSLFRRGKSSWIAAISIFLLLSSYLLQLSLAESVSEQNNAENQSEASLTQQDAAGKGATAEDSSLSNKTDQNKNQTKSSESNHSNADPNGAVKPKPDDVKADDESLSSDDEKAKNGTEEDAKSGEKEEGEGDEEENDFKKTIKKFSDMLSNNKSAVQNMMFALIGLTSLVVLYFIIKTMRLRQKKSKNRKYGVLTNGMEMDHLESDSDDEDTTVFEINHRR